MDEVHEIHRGLTDEEILFRLNAVAHVGRFERNGAVLRVCPRPRITSLYGTPSQSIEDRIEQRRSVRTLAEADAAIFHLNKKG